ncbi:hypothetical protein [Gryllotalpicola koreensis]|uniref:Phage tail protein n=1 Tax=Gryllotalpicola koreensis TaxID=993086 RepID=A0ABP7ZUN9_9MICO
MANTVKNVHPYISKQFAVIFPGAAEGDTVDYAPACSSALLNPSSSTQTWKGGTPEAVFTDVTSPTYTFDVTIGQDWVDVESFANYLEEHAGELIEDIAYTPRPGAPTWTFDAYVPPVPVGGNIDDWATAQLSFPVVGSPVKTPAGA